MQKLNNFLIIAIIIHWEVKLWIFTVELWLIIEIMLQSDYSEK